jgi:2,4-dienoyl-CoA reductase-like NADH-dependent reductase (Old Yellow Enzyme family)
MIAALFSPIKLADLELDNRIVVSPMCQYSADDGSANDWQVRREAGIATRAIGLIATAQQAEAIVADGKADMIALARAMLDDPRWGWHAAQSLSGDVKRPPQYARAAPKLWPGAAYRA